LGSMVRSGLGSGRGDGCRGDCSKFAARAAQHCRENTSVERRGGHRNDRKTNRAPGGGGGGGGVAMIVGAARGSLDGRRPSSPTRAAWPSRAVLAGTGNQVASGEISGNRARRRRLDLYRPTDRPSDRPTVMGERQLKRSS